MSDRVRRQEGAIAMALDKCGLEVARTGRRRWGFELVNGRPFTVVAQADEEWLLLSAETEHEPAIDQFWPLLEVNGQLGGPAKLAVAPRARRVQLRAEIPLFDDIGLGERVAEACRGFVHALETLEGKGRARLKAASSDADADAPDGAASEWSALVAEAGWPVAGSDRDGLRVELDVPGGFHQCRIEDHDGETRFAVEVLRVGALSASSRPALGLLLLSACAVVRLARAAVGTFGDDEAARFEVAFGAPPSVLEAGHALSALSVACRTFAREARALTDANVAARYLEMRGWSSEMRFEK